MAVASVDPTTLTGERALPQAVQVPTAPEFQPPYPHRTNPFQQPNVEQVARSGMLESSGGLIELKGFIDVGKPRVLLAMDDRLEPLAEGDEWHGVKVIKINHHQVILQRGRIRWTESLFDRHLDSSESEPTTTDSSSSEPIETSDDL